MVQVLDCIILKCLYPTSFSHSLKDQGGYEYRYYTKYPVTWNARNRFHRGFKKKKIHDKDDYVNLFDRLLYPGTVFEASLQAQSSSWKFPRASFSLGFWTSPWIFVFGIFIGMFAIILCSTIHNTQYTIYNTRHVSCIVLKIIKNAHKFF